MKKSDDYWDTYYDNALLNKTNHVIPSQFASFCALEFTSLGLNQVIEIASGDGRDCIFFSKLGLNVMALEASESAIKLIKTKSQTLENMSVLQVDVTKTQLPNKLRLSDQCAYYARFFIHTLADHQLELFFDNLASAMEPGDYFFTEFRNEKDEFLTKGTPKHFRRFYTSRFIKSVAEGKKLKCIYEVEGRGLAKWNSDDAFVSRQVYAKAAK